MHVSLDPNVAGLFDESIEYQPILNIKYLFAILGQSWNIIVLVSRISFAPPFNQFSFSVFSLFFFFPKYLPIFLRTYVRTFSRRNPSNYKS